LPKGSSVELRYQLEEPAPVSIRDSVYPWMSGYILIRSNPYFSKTDANGRFHITKLPAGTHTLRFWHEKCGYLKSIQIGDAVTTKSGKLQLELNKPTIDLGTITLPNQLLVSPTKQVPK
jgi:hypothetical protein